MHKLLLVALLLASLATMSVYSMETMLAPPARPKEFKSPNELRRYLKALNEYYAIVGRPRFGKRMSNEFRTSDFFSNRGDDNDASDSLGWADY